MELRRVIPTSERKDKVCYFCGCNAVRYYIETVNKAESDKPFDACYCVKCGNKIQEMHEYYEKNKQK